MAGEIGETLDRLRGVQMMRLMDLHAAGVIDESEYALNLGIHAGLVLAMKAVESPEDFALPDTPDGLR